MHSSGTIVVQDLHVLKVVVGLLFPVVRTRLVRIWVFGEDIGHEWGLRFIVIKSPFIPLLPFDNVLLVRKIWGCTELVGEDVEDSWGM